MPHLPRQLSSKLLRTDVPYSVTRSGIRVFSSTTRNDLRSAELTSTQLSTLRCQPERLWNDIHSTAVFGPGRRYGSGPEKTGLSRLTLSDADKQARDWFVEVTKSLGCDVQIDETGNVFAIRPGLTNGIPATFVGSHLDSQPLGGRFDGVLGVMAGIEMLRVLNENWIETEGPVGVVNWTNEEGARFPVSMMGSGEWAGVRSKGVTGKVEEVSAGSDSRRRTVEEELKRIGYLGKTPGRVDEGGVKMAGHFELHIEQGPRLEQAGQKIGVVTGVQAYKWFEIKVRGRASHAGTTPMNMRADAVNLAAHILTQLPVMAEAFGGLATCGVLRAEPGSINTTPDEVVFTVDMRHETDEGLQKMVKEAGGWWSQRHEEHNESARENKAREVQMEVKEIFHSPAIKFDETAVRCVEESAKDYVQNVLGRHPYDVPKMVSGAGHDSVNTSRHCPTAMVFAPCRNGVSHHPEEWCEQADCATGTDVIIQSVLRFDQRRHEPVRLSSGI